MALDGLMDAIADRGWYVWDDFLNPQEVQALRECIPERWKRAKLVETKRFSVLRISGAIKSNGLIYQWATCSRLFGADGADPV